MNRAPLACSRYTSTRRCGTSISTRSTDHGVVTPSSCRYNSMLSIASPPLGDCATAYQLPRRPTPNPDGPRKKAFGKQHHGAVDHLAVDADGSATGRSRSLDDAACPRELLLARR